MKNKRVKGYWLKRKEAFNSLGDAKSRAGVLRLNEHIAHVVIDKGEKIYNVQYSVAKWYLAECKRAGIQI